MAEDRSRLMKYKLMYLPVAIGNIEAIKEHVSQENKAAAIKLVGEMKRLISTLVEMPNKYPVYQDNPAYRFIPVGSYIIFYKVDDDKRMVKIHRILHAKMDLRKLLGQ